MDWEKYSASVDVLQPLDCQRACTDPSDTHPSKRMALNTFCTTPDNTGPASPESFKIRTPDRLIVDLAEYRRGYCYSVETPDAKMSAVEHDIYTPRRVLDKEDSNDFSSFAGLQEGATAALFSPRGIPASSPFAAHTRQPFADAASLRSNLSDYGYDTASDDEDEDQEAGDAWERIGFAQGSPEGGQQKLAQQEFASWPQSQDVPDQAAGFWADVGAPAKLFADAGDADIKSGPRAEGVQWEVNDWDSGSDTSEQPDEDMQGAHAPGHLGPPLHNPGVLLPWDMD